MNPRIESNDSGLLSRITNHKIYINKRISTGGIMRVSKWGNSLAVRLPAVVVEALELKDGDDIEIRVPEPRVFEVIRKPGMLDLLERLREFRGRLPADFKFDRDEANGR